MSLKKLIEKGKESKWRNHLIIESPVGRMVRTERYKYWICKDGEDREMLVDLEIDPGEMLNLAGNKKYQTQLNLHRKIICQWATEQNDSLAKSFIIKPYES